MGLAQPLGYAKPEEKGVDGQIVRGESGAHTFFTQAFQSSLTRDL